jgi:hypothetical protein
MLADPARDGGMLRPMKRKRTSMKFNTYDAVPPWARFLTLDEFRAFLETIERELLARRLIFEDRDGLLQVASPDGQIAQCGLANLAVKCGAAGRDGYAREVTAHFNRLFGETPEIAPFPEHFDDVRSVVKVRIYTNEHILENGAKVVSRPLAAGIQAVAVYDLPNIVASMSPEHLETWKVTPVDVFRVAIANTGREKIEREALRLGAAEIFLLSDQAGFAASQVLHLSTYLPPSKLGAIVALPSRYLLLCYPIQLSTVIEALRELVPFVGDIYEETSGDDERNRLSTDLYWWRKGQLVSMRAGMNLAGLPGSVIAPPQEFINTVLARAAPPGKR